MKQRNFNYTEIDFTVNSNTQKRYYNKSLSLSNNINKLIYQQNILNTLIFEVNNAKSLQEFLSILCKEVLHNFNAERVAIYELFQGRIPKNFTKLAEEKNNDSVLPLNNDKNTKLTINYLIKNFLNNNKPIILSDLCNKNLPLYIYKVYKHTDIKSIIHIPIRINNRILCLSTYLYTSNKVWRKSETDFLTSISNIALMAINTFNTKENLESLKRKDILRQTLFNKINQCNTLTQKIDEFSQTISNEFNANNITVIKFDTIYNTFSKLNVNNNLEQSVNNNLIEIILNNIKTNEKIFYSNNVQQSVLNLAFKSAFNKSNINSFIFYKIYSEKNINYILLITSPQNLNISEENIYFLKESSNYLSIAIKEFLLSGKTEFISNISHEIKNPLSVISGYTDILAEELNDSNNYKKEILSIKNNINKITNIIENFLSLSKIEENEAQCSIKFSDNNLLEIINSATAPYLCSLTNKKIKLAVNCDKHHTIYCNSTLMEQVITNLIQNSIKHSKNLSCIQIDTIHNNDNSIINIVDNGSGLDSKDLSNIFKRFYQCNNTEGVGLGLSIVQTILKLHKASIKVSSQKGKGIMFSIILPRHGTTSYILDDEPPDDFL